MDTITQLSFLPDAEIKIKKEDVESWGTFKDSLRAPVHRWFTYPAGFSYKAVYHSIEKYGIQPGMVVYDPFMGSGTTNLSAKTLGINSYGVEAHPFVFKITRAKMAWNIDRDEAIQFVELVRKSFKGKKKIILSFDDFELKQYFPELVLKCYTDETLENLLVIRDLLFDAQISEPVYDFFFVVITALLRSISSAATGWPYIAPKKAKVSSDGKDALEEFIKLSYQMLDDLRQIKQLAGSREDNSWHKIFLADSKNVKDLIPDNSVDHIFTSPPYLNNFDYSDRTRLELYFWGEAKSWGDISQNIRTKLMTSATTQIARNDPKYILSDEIRETCPDVADFIQSSADELSVLRMEKGGKKSYDLMVIGYFNDMFQIMSESFRVLKNDTKALFVLGDSAPYGVHIPTDKLIAEIGLRLGFDNYEIDVLRERGGKWKANPQRHNVPLRESIVILEKK